MVGFGPLWAHTVAALFLNVERCAGQIGVQFAVIQGCKWCVCGSHFIMVSYCNIVQLKIANSSMKAIFRKLVWHWLGQEQFTVVGFVGTITLAAAVIARSSWRVHFSHLSLFSGTGHGYLFTLLLSTCIAMPHGTSQFYNLVSVGTHSLSCPVALGSVCPVNTSTLLSSQYMYWRGTLNTPQGKLSCVLQLRLS